MKEIILDTETTGLSVQDGHRIVEIGCIEIDNLVPTNKKFHYYLNPKEKFQNKHLKYMVILMNFCLRKINLKRL